MSLADEVQALELERDTLKANLSAAQAAVDAMKGRASISTDYWRERAERAEARSALLEAYERTQAYAREPVRDPGEWHVAFAYDGAEPAGLDFKGESLAQMVSGLLLAWFERPAALQISITEPQRDRALVEPAESA